MESSEVEIKEDILVLPISFGNPANEIIYGELRLSRNKEHTNRTVAMIGIPTQIDLKELFAFLQKSQSSFKLTHIKILNQEDTTPTKSESYYSLLCSFAAIQHSETFIKDLNGACVNSQLTTTKCCIYYLVNSQLIINKQSKSKEMHFPPPRITTAELIKQNSNPQTFEEDNIANCGCCLDSVEPSRAFTPQLSPKNKYKLFHEPFDTSETPSPPPNFAFNPQPLESKWYDEGNTVCFVLCGHFFHVMCLMRCEQNSCPICRHYLFPEPSSVCNSCSLCTKDLWVCLTCGHVGCGRFSNQCAVAHFDSTSHVWAKNTGSSHVWDYADDDYVYRILMAEMMNDGATKLVSLQTQTEDGIDGSSKHLPHELDVMSSVKQEELISEYNFVVQDRLKRLQSFHKSKRNRVMKNAQHQLTKLDHDVTKLQREIANKKRNNDKLLARYKKKYNVEFVDDIEYLRKQLEEERDRSDKLKKMSHRVFVEQKTFNEKLKEYENTLKQSLSMTETTLNAEINNMKHELRDYQAHIDTSNKMKKVVETSELDGAQVSVKPGKSKNNQKRQMKNRPHSNKKTKKSRKARK
eukprot:111883_1